MSPETLPQPAGSLRTSDIVKFAYFHHLRRFWPLVVVVLGFSSLGLLAVISTGKPDRLQNPGSFYFFGLMLVVIQLVSPYLSARRQYSTTQFLREAMRFHITREKIQLEGPNFSSELTWPLVNAVYETKNAFLIYQTAQTAWILPKRFFGGDTALVAQCRQLISQSLAGSQRLRSTPVLNSWF